MVEEAPDWLDAAFLASALQEGDDSRLPVIDDFSVKPAVAAGNNYTSRLYRVVVDYRVGESDKNESVSVIVKRPIQKGVMQEISDQSDFFSKEPKMYNVLLPRMNTVCKLEFGPKAFNCPIKYGMVINDLSIEGYTMIDRFQQLDFEHCQTAIEKLAKFHAASVACYHEDPDLVKEIGKEDFYIDGGAMEEHLTKWLSSSVKLLTDALQEIEVDPDQIDFISSRAEGLWDSMVKICQPQTDGSLNVLNHGDLWSSNILFKYDKSGCVSDAMFIDYQISRYSSPIIDMLYFIFTSVNKEVREVRLQDLYKIYLDNLNRTLEQLGCKERLGREEFDRKLKSGSDFALVAIACVLPFTKCDSDNIMDMEEFELDSFAEGDKDGRFLQVYKSKRFRGFLPSLVKLYYSIASP